MQVDGSGGIAVEPDPDGPADDRVRLVLSEPDGAFDPQRHLLLGLVDEAPRFAAVEGKGTPLREVGGELSDLDRELAITAAAVTNWHRAEPRCPRCGAETAITHGGFMRHCPACGLDVFPRTDPAMIVSILDDDNRILLAHQHTWAPGRVSVIAGFCEAGESFEQTVHREVAEEVGLTLSSLRYLRSQPWPFPRSVMIAFVARAATHDIVVDGKELTQADWYTVERFRDELAAGTTTAPMSLSVASWMLRLWERGALPVPEG